MPVSVESSSVSGRPPRSLHLTGAASSADTSTRFLSRPATTPLGGCPALPDACLLSRTHEAAAAHRRHSGAVRAAHTLGIPACPGLPSRVRTAPYREGRGICRDGRRHHAALRRRGRVVARCCCLRPIGGTDGRDQHRAALVAVLGPHLRTDPVPAGEELSCPQSDDGEACNTTLLYAPFQARAEAEDAHLSGNPNGRLGPLTRRPVGRKPIVGAVPSSGGDLDSAVPPGARSPSRVCGTPPRGCARGTAAFPQ